MKSVWIVGSSIITHAFREARCTYDGTSLGIERNNYRVWWQGKGGLRWDGLVPRIEYLLSFEDPPDILVIHCGANSIGQINLFDFRLTIYYTLEYLRSILPNTKFVWSQMIPRLDWKYSYDCKAMNLSAARLNNYAASLVIRMGGFYIRYPEITWHSPELFSDGVHLSSLGNNFFLYHLQRVLLSISSLQ